MSNTKEVYLTQEGLDKLKEELDYLKLEKRPEVISALKDARALGDLSENAEYDAARNEQAIVIKEVSTDKVSIGNSVKIEYVEDNDTEVYSIVGSKEADPFQNKISNESPIAKAILGLSVGDIAHVDSPNGKYSVKVVEIF